MTRKHLHALSLIVVLASPWAVGDEPRLAAKLTVPSLTSITRDVGKVMDQFSQGASATVALAVSALAFNPQMARFDLSRPFQLRIYGYETDADSGTRLGTCVVVRIRKEFLDKFVVRDDDEIFVKRSGELAILSESRELLNLLEVPPLEEDAEKRVLFECWPSYFITHFKTHLDDLIDMGISDLAKSASMSRRNLVAFKILKNNLRYMGELLKDVKALSGEIIVDETSIRLNLDIDPVDDSQFDEFLTAQPSNGRLTFRFGADARSGSTNLKLTQAARRSVKNFMKSLMVEVSRHSEDAGDLAVLDALIAAAAGPCDYQTRLSERNYYNYFRIYLLDGGAARLRKILDQRAKSVDGCYQVTGVPMFRGDAGVVLKIHPESVAVIHGVQSAERLRWMLNEDLLGDAESRSDEKIPMGILTFLKSDEKLKGECVAPFETIKRMAGKHDEDGD